MTDYLAIPPILGFGGLAVAFIIYHIMSRHNHGDGVVKKIGDQIQLGAMVFMHREYKMLGIFSLVLLVAIFVSPLGVNTAIAFLVGAVSSATAGYLGMFAATKANVRTAIAAHNHGQSEALSIAFYGGSVMGDLNDCLAAARQRGVTVSVGPSGCDCETDCVGHQVHVTAEGWIL